MNLLMSNSSCYLPPKIEPISSISFWHCPSNSSGTCTFLVPTMYQWKRPLLNRSRFLAEYGSELLDAANEIRSNEYRFKCLQYNFHEEKDLISPHDADTEELFNIAAFYGSLNFFLFMKQYHNDKLKKCINGIDTHEKFINPLSEAIRMCQSHVVAFLLAHGADPLLALSNRVTPLHYALSIPVAKRSQHYKHFCEGDPVFILQMLNFYLPDGFNATKQLSNDGIAYVGGIHSDSLEIARSRDSSDAKDLLADAISWIYSPDEVHPLEIGTSGVDDDEADDSKAPQPRCNICKTRFQSVAVLKSHEQSRKHKRKAKEAALVRNFATDAARSREGLSMTRWVKINQEGASEFLSVIPEDLQDLIFGLVDYQDRFSLAVSCKYVNRILQRRLLWRSLDFTKYGDLLNDTVIRTFLEAHLTKLTSLKTWKDGHNFLKFYIKPSSYTRRYPNLRDPDPFTYWSDEHEIPIGCERSTLHLIPSLCRSLISLEVNTGDVSLAWVSKVLSRNSALTELKLRSGILVSQSGFKPLEELQTFENVTKFHLALTAHPKLFEEPNEYNEHPWRRLFFPRDHLWCSETQESLIDAHLNRLISSFPHLTHLGVDIGGWHQLPGEILDAIASRPAINSLELGFFAPDDDSQGSFVNSIIALLKNRHFPHLQTLKLRDCPSAWTECPISISSIFDDEELCRSLSYLTALEIDCQYLPEDLSAFSALQKLTRLSIKTSGISLYACCGLFLSHLTALVDFQIFETVHSRGTGGNYGESPALFETISTLPYLQKACIQSHFLIKDVDFELDRILPRIDLHESLFVSVRCESMPLFQQQFYPTLKHIKHLSIESLEGEDFEPRKQFNPIPVLKQLLLLESMSIYGPVSDRIFTEPFYHDRLKSFSLNFIDSTSEEEIFIIREKIVERLAYSLPRLEELRLANLELEFGPFFILDVFCGFPRLKTMMLHNTQSRTWRKPVDAVDKRLRLKGKSPIPLPHFR